MVYQGRRETFEKGGSFLWQGRKKEGVVGLVVHPGLWGKATFSQKGGSFDPPPPLPCSIL